MLGFLLFLLLIFSGSVFGAAVFGRDSEQVLPVTCCGLVLFVYLFGLAGALPAGVWAAAAVGLCLWGFSLFRVWRTRAWADFRRRLFTPAFLTVLVLFAVILFYTFDLKACLADELSHWADVVKIMTLSDDFGTNPAFDAWYPGYPPAMSIFQYVAQKLSLPFSSASFCQWELYACYQVFCVALFAPFFAKLSRRPLFLLIAGGILLACPTFFFQDFFCSVYIDPFLGILSGTGLAAMIWSERKDALYAARILCSCAILAIAKAAGLLYAVTLALAFFAQQVGFLRQRNARPGRYAGWALLCAACPLVPYLLWSRELTVSNTKTPFSLSIDWSVLFGVLLGTDQSYRTEVLHSFLRAFVTSGLPVSPNIKVIGLVCPYLLLLILLPAATWFLSGRSGADRMSRRVVVTALVGQTVIYTVGTCVSYMFRFSEYEARILASFDRYISIAMLALLIPCLLFVLLFVQDAFLAAPVRPAAVSLAAVGFLFVLPLGPAYRALTRANVAYTADRSRPYEALSQAVRENVPACGHVWFISQYDDFDSLNNADYGMMRYQSRPALLQGAFSPHYFTDLAPAPAEKDGNPSSITAEEWRDLLLQTDCRYVALFHLNDYFYESFSSLFSDPEAITPYTLYRLDTGTQLLVRCDADPG